MTDSSASPAIELADRFAIHELLALYGHLIDEREWTRLAEIFTDDVVFDASDFGAEVVNGRDRLVEVWSRPDAGHPLAHHASNIVLLGSAGPDSIDVLSKGLGVGPNGRVASIVYRDVVRQTDSGWRIARRTATLRRPTT
jgi:hypothetical protein